MPEKMKLQIEHHHQGRLTMKTNAEGAVQRDNEYVLFASSRPSRTSEVVASEQELELRRACEQAWAERAGIDMAVFVDNGWTRTGSPTGSKTVHELDDYVEDFGGGF
jgi:hypothetical protein